MCAQATPSHRHKGYFVDQPLARPRDGPRQRFKHHWLIITFSEHGACKNIPPLAKERGSCWSSGPGYGGLRGTPAPPPSACVPRPWPGPLGSSRQTLSCPISGPHTVPPVPSWQTHTVASPVVPEKPCHPGVPKCVAVHCIPPPTAGPQRKRPLPVQPAPSLFST